MKNAIVLTSGGLDSVVLAYYLKKIKKINKLKLIFLDYNQNSLREELFCVRKLAKKLDADLKIVNLRWLGEISTSLINRNIKKKRIEKIRVKKELLSWYVPCRNLLFLSISLVFAEVGYISKKEKYDIYIGLKDEGNLRFRDTTPEFLEEMNKIGKFCTEKGKYRFIAPFIKKEKEELIKLSKKMKINLEETYSCYVGGGFINKREKKIPIHCGVCSSCRGRKKAFKFSNNEDPTVYKVKPYI